MSLGILFFSLLWLELYHTILETVKRGLSGRKSSAFCLRYSKIKIEVYLAIWSSVLIEQKRVSKSLRRRYE